mmetsp:Transcript_24911/g.64895  ORF Transcript_24911/g.64895 Transcript_24911/m.64895 type:complete len:510 (+) Transcript_24911:282-1811(+)|eukprot:CAMPEP_0182919288 /NCGR_PEP_ID=MMETSP0105_2-20130417/2609_1 /TAXON_ID=81532 ORGANISM="Acanthoeca-like sp., Strain 10tr" /NCGR_SAMPLE_ID=MMETSP0105_2 /ASSEMBLY_ACC=CAM_ASM_000205 /LENGTH=509 /DNA_ID=CAMNT_0025056449 /DNA_START=196 /DNA_END=1725 /DNA_ORIENTATION=+
MAGRVQVVPQISQETFDQVVKENIEDFDMTPEEAVADAAEQFKSQGVDLSNILLRAPTEGADGGDEIHPALVAVNEYMALLSDDAAPSDKLEAVLKDIKGFCKEKPVKLLMGNNGALAVLLAGCEKFLSGDKYKEPSFGDVLAAAVEALCKLLQEQPDLAGPVQADCFQTTSGETAQPTKEISRLCALVKATADAPEHVQGEALRACRFSMFMHESNRQAFAADGLIELCLVAAEGRPQSAEVITQSMMCLRALTKDDDPRVPFGRANEHVKAICSEYKGLDRLLQVIRECHKGKEPEPTAAAELFKTLSQLASRDEYCRHIVDLGCLDFVLPALEAFQKNETVAHAGCTLLRAVAGNDEVKRIIGDRGGIALIIDTMQQQLRSEKVAEQGASALAALMLKTPANAKAVAACNGPHILVTVMHMHPEAIKLQRQACMALRNCVVRNRELVDDVLGQGAEAVLNIALEKHKDCADEAKAALRDLGCKVDLKMRWTGEKNNIDGTARQKDD